MVFGKLFSPGADKTQEADHVGQSGKSMRSQARTELDDRKRLPSNKSDKRKKKSRYSKGIL